MQASLCCNFRDRLVSFCCLALDDYLVVSCDEALFMNYQISPTRVICLATTLLNVGPGVMSTKTCKEERLHFSFRESLLVASGYHSGWVPNRVYTSPRPLHSI